MSAGWPFPAEGSEPGGGKLALRCDLQARRRAGRVPPTPARPVPGWQHFALNILLPLSDGLGSTGALLGKQGARLWVRLWAGEKTAVRCQSTPGPCPSMWVSFSAGCSLQGTGATSLPLMRQCHLACVRVWPAQNSWSGTCLCFLAI